MTEDAPHVTLTSPGGEVLAVFSKVGSRSFVNRKGPRQLVPVII